MANLRAAPHEAISRLLAPMALDRFLQDHWQQRHVHIARGAGGLVGDLLSVGDLDRLFSGTAIPIAQVDMGQNAVGVQKADIDRGGYADAARMLAAHRSGNTIILRAAELWLPTLADLCAAASCFFHAEAQTNVYMTPAQSSYPHWDSHDLFIIQVAGRKTWHLHAAETTMPLPAYRFSPTLHAVGEQIGSFTLEPGDIAYLPRGLAHNPMADDYSVHISLGVLVKSWADLLLHAVSDAIRDDPALRGALPLAAGGSFDSDRIARQWPTIARRALLSATLDRPLETVEREIVASRRDCVSGQFAAFAAASDISLTSMVTVPARSTKLGDAQGGRMRATFDGVELSFDARFRDAIEYLLAQGRARVADIPAESDAHRIALAQRLAEEGCLAAVPIDAAA